ncbi:MarR family winged helix-turn-helix transcriptional regulator [Virgibacillus soli]|uniref:MarR family transcriptional regulator n=1 Tax=Paracerasibacillus soli TaxID=480284 RepID=A0ABU5CVD2_9BACI|nr:MarR family transcriptional regulator [Virgibacillus soli]MDY0409767.1 MarR family transcriptional regulator [Virgibacillus soli]
MMRASIFELIRVTELLNNETVIRFMDLFNENVGISQILVLSQLQQNGPQMQSWLAKRLGYTSGALTGIANKLIKENYAVRKYDETDRRIVLLAITEKGTELLQNAQKLGQKMETEVYSVLSEAESNQILTIHRKLLDHMLNINSPK